MDKNGSFQHTSGLSSRGKSWELGAEMGLHKDCTKHAAAIQKDIDCKEYSH